MQPENVQMILLVSIVLIVLLLLSAVAYFRAACQLSVIEGWLCDFADLRDRRKNVALTRRLMRAIMGREFVRSKWVLQRLKRRFYALLMVASTMLVWTVGLIFSI